MNQMRMRQDWRNVDGDPAAADRYLTMAAEAVADMRVRASAKLRLGVGTRVLEVGCGNGLEAERMAALVGRTGFVTGVDFSAEMIALARTRTEPLGLPLTFHTADAHALPFADDSFDAARIERTLQHLADPRQAVRELVRVVRPGGSICALEPDWQATFATGNDIEVQRAITRYKTDIDIANGAIGRELPDLLLSAGCTDISVEPNVAGTRDLIFADAMVGLRRCLQGAVAQKWISQDAANAWWANAETRAGNGTFYSIGFMITASGRVP
jgi:ubiquinone/menaquinone biosynthesis C-methylase UbiE